MTDEPSDPRTEDVQQRTTTTATGFISGTVTDADGNGLSGVNVSVYVSGGGFAAFTTTDSNGDYSVELSEGDYDLTFEYVGYDPVERTSVNVSASSTTTVDVTLSESFRKVVGDTGSPYDVGVLAEQTASSGWNAAVRAVTDSDDSRTAALDGQARGKGYGVYARAVGTAVRARSTGSFGTALEGITTSSTGAPYSVYGRNDALDGTAVFANSTAESGQPIAVDASVSAPLGTALNAEANALSGSSTGVDASVESPRGTAIRATANASSGFNYGIDADVSSTRGTVFNARAFADTGSTYGLSATVDSRGGTAVYGDAIAGTGSPVAIEANVDAANGYGLYSQGRVYARRNVTATDPPRTGDHVATFENTSTDPGADVLALVSGVNDPGTDVNFVTFFDDGGTQIGAIQGNGSGDVQFTGTTADFAEYFPKADPDDEFDSGEVVGLRGGEVVPASADADAALVVTTSPIVTGNDPEGEGGREDHVALSLVGQVPVAASGPVEAGDLLVASPDDDGRAVPRRRVRSGEPGADPAAGRPVVGLALESLEGDGEVLTLVGGPGPDALGRSDPGAGETTGDDPSDDGRIDELEARLERKDERIDALERENEALRDRLARVETELGVGGDAATPADD